MYEWLIIRFRGYFLDVIYYSSVCGLYWLFIMLRLLLCIHVYTFHLLISFIDKFHVYCYTLSLS